MRAFVIHSVVETATTATSATQEFQSNAVSSATERFHSPPDFHEILGASVARLQPARSRRSSRCRSPEPPIRGNDRRVLDVVSMFAATQGPSTLQIDHRRAAPRVLDRSRSVARSSPNGNGVPDWPYRETFLRSVHQADVDGRLQRGRAAVISGHAPSCE